MVRLVETFGRIGFVLRRLVLVGLLVVEQVLKGKIRVMDDLRWLIRLFGLLWGKRYFLVLGVECGHLMLETLTLRKFLQRCGSCFILYINRDRRMFDLCGDQMS